MTTSLEVQKYLETHSLRDLNTNHGVHHRFSTRNRRKFSLSYDQIEAELGDVIAQECRGLVLMADRELTADEVVGRTQILALPMHRFFNYGQVQVSADLQDPNLIIQEKLDGTLVIVYYDPVLDKLSVATRSVPDADVVVTNHNQTFEELFWSTWWRQTQEVPEDGSDTGEFSDTDMLRRSVKDHLTFCFELCTPHNRVVVPYNDHKLWYLAMRSNLTGEELSVGLSSFRRVSSPKSFYWFSETGMRTLAELQKWVADRSPADHEGVIAVDSRGHRVKFKSPGYIALSQCLSAVQASPRKALELVLGGKLGELLSLLPQAAVVNSLDLQARFRRWCEFIDWEYNRVHSSDRKEFVAAVQAGSGRVGVQISRWLRRTSSASGWVQSKRPWTDSFLDDLLSQLSDSNLSLFLAAARKVTPSWDEVERAADMIRALESILGVVGAAAVPVPLEEAGSRSRLE